MAHRSDSKLKRDHKSLLSVTRQSLGTAFPPIWLAAAVLAMAIFGVYGRSLDVPFVLDDKPAIVDNPSITSLWPLTGTADQPGPLNPAADLPTSARPLVNLTFAVNYWADGLNTAGYHLVNMLLHFLNALLLWGILRRTLLLPCFDDRFGSSAGWLALAASLLWAVHPLQTEAVIYVTQRTELMVAFFYLATFYCSLKYWALVDFLSLPLGESRAEDAMLASSATDHDYDKEAKHSRAFWLTMAVLACLCGMASKEVMVSAPLMILLYERAFLTNSLFAVLRRSWPLYVGLASTWLLLLALNINSPRGASAGFHLGLPVASWWLTQCKVLFLYLKLAVWPAPLLLHYELPYLHSFSEAWMYAVPIALLAVIAIVLLVRNRILGFLLAFMAAILAPTFVVPVLTEMAAERRMYMPLAVLIVLLVVGMHLAYQAWTNRSAGLLPSAVGSRAFRGSLLATIALSAIYGYVSSQRHLVYRDELKIWQQVVDNQPGNHVALYNLGLELNYLRRGAESLAELQKSVAANPKYPDSRSALGFALINARRVPEAIENLNIALSLEPNHAPALNNLGIAYMRLGDLPKAIENLEHATQVAPKFADAHHNLGRALASSGKVDEALKELQTAAQLAPNDLDVLNDFAMLLAATGQRPQAIELTQRILENKPDYAAAQHALAMMLYESGDVRGSINHFQRYLQLNPRDVEAMCNLASILATQGDFENAALICRQATTLAPDLPEAHFGLGTSLVKLGQLPEAIGQLQQTLKLRPNYFAAHVELARALTAANRAAEAIQTAEQGLAAARGANNQSAVTQLEQWLEQNKPKK